MEYRDDETFEGVAVYLVFVAIAVVVLIIAFAVMGCGEVPDINGQDEPATEETALLIEESELQPAAENPTCSNPMKFRDGTLWKPNADHTGNLVVLINNQFHNRFQSCYVVRNNGTQEQLQFTGFSNGNRQTWRGNLPGGRYQGVVTCMEDKQMCIWQFKGDSSKRQE